MINQTTNNLSTVAPNSRIIPTSESELGELITLSSESLRSKTFGQPPPLGDGSLNILEIPYFIDKEKILVYCKLNMFIL